MARTTPVKKAWRSLTWLLVIVAGLTMLNGAGVLWQNGSWAPKLALDLEGGTQIILSPKLKAATLKDGAEAARDALLSGAAAKVLDAFIEASRG